MLGNRHLAALLATGALIAVPVAGCGGGDDNGSSDTSEADEATAASTTSGAAATGPGGTVELAATEYKFNPSDPTVKSGEVTFDLKNDGQTAHSLEVEDVNGEDQELEGEVSAAQSGTLKVNLSPGKYEFYCPVDGHKELGMTGEITVK